MAQLIKLQAKPLLEFKALGVPVPQGSKSALPGKGKAEGTVVLVEGGNRATKLKPANRLKDWRKALGYAARRSMVEKGLETLNESLVMGFCFVMPRPDSHIVKATRNLAKDKQRLEKRAPAFPGVKPDLSKLIRAAEDALEGIVYRNDSRIVGYTFPVKIYDDEEEAGAKIDVWRLA